MVDKEKESKLNEIDTNILGQQELQTEKDYNKLAEDIAIKVKSVTEKSSLISSYLKQTFELINPKIDSESLNSIVDAMDIILNQKKKEASKKNQSTAPSVQAQTFVTPQATSTNKTNSEENKKENEKKEEIKADKPKKPRFDEDFM